MRLGQLARKLALRPSEIIDFLASNNIVVEDSSNAKLQNEHVTLVMQRFAPAMLAEVEKELIAEEQHDVAETPVELTKPVETIEEVLVQDNALPDDEVAITSTLPLPAAGADADKNEVIKAPKIALSGLKVVGKIDLPTPKKKETSAEPSAEMPVENTTPPKRRMEDRKGQKRERSYTSQPRKNPIALQREREAQEAEQQKKEAAERKKEQRTRNYLNKVKSAPTKSMKLIDEQFEEISVTDVSTPPKTWLGKFFRWLRS